RIAARVAYSGTDFAGYQVQPTCRTVQGELERALATRFPHEGSIRTVGASRTDIGVHARGQALHFDLADDGLDEQFFDKLEYQWNALLPQDITVYNVREAPSPTAEEVKHGYLWHANRVTRGKVYVYRLGIGKTLSPLLARHVAYFPPSLFKLDQQKFQEALKLFEGEHDFRAFVCQSKSMDWDEISTVRTIRSITVAEEDDESVEVTLDGALYKQVRMIIGAAVTVGCGLASLSAITSALLEGRKGKELDKHLKPAPAHGLCLETVLYDEPGF
ncbi:unnamed protein product, partial [Chrysoparadoxa australica]